MALLDRLRGRSMLLGAIVVAACAATASQNSAFADFESNETVSVRLDQARIIKMPERVTTLVIGNPLIADIALQAGGLMVITGKGYGATNVVALDRNGNSLFEKNVLVKGPTGEVVVVYRGIQRETYSCAPNCEPRITLGDSQQYFNQTLTQSVTRSTQASALPR